MPILRSSRYDSLPTVEVEEVVSIGQRLVPPPDLTEPALNHRVTRGESLDLLARRYYGSEELWWRIADANQRFFPTDLCPGEVLRIPARLPAVRR